MAKIDQRFYVEGMTCINCKKILTKSIFSLPGVSNVIIKLQTKEVIVVFNQSKVTEEEIVEQITNHGYGVLHDG